MKTLLCNLCIVAAAAAVAPAASAGSAIVKCVDRSGHVTLTDQPCDSGAATVPVDIGPDGTASGSRVEHYPAPRALPRSASGPRPAPQRMRLARDVATLKAARAQLLLMDAADKPQPSLAAN
jgi:hypothetical protein